MALNVEGSSDLDEGCIDVDRISEVLFRESHFSRPRDALKSTCAVTFTSVGFVVDKVAWGRFSPSTSVSPANLHSTNCSTVTLIYHLGLVQ
jgi:hypothetical protein